MDEFTNEMNAILVDLPVDATDEQRLRAELDLLDGLIGYMLGRAHRDRDDDTVLAANLLTIQRYLRGRIEVRGRLETLQDGNVKETPDAEVP